MESNDSPEIPDREETSDFPGLLSGGDGEQKGKNFRFAQHKTEGLANMLFSFEVLSSKDQRHRRDVDVVVHPNTEKQCHW